MSEDADRVQVIEFVRHLMRASQAAAIEWIGDDDVFRTNILRNSHDASRASGIQVTRSLPDNPAWQTSYSIQTYISDVHFGMVIISSFEIPGPCEESNGENIGDRLWELMEVVQERGGAATVDAMVDVIVHRLSEPADKVVDSPEGWSAEFEAWVWPPQEDDGDGSA